jgi:hypothetical protein
VAEWLKAAVSKTVMGHWPIESSNLSLSATTPARLHSAGLAPDAPARSVAATKASRRFPAAGINSDQGVHACASKEVRAMAESGLFIGWGAVVRGREGQALEVFNEFMQYYADLQRRKEIESFEPVLLEQHGGDLTGFILLKGDTDRIAKLRTDPEFQKRTLRAALYVDDLGVVGAITGAGVSRIMQDFAEETSKIKTAVAV